jgi:hypothetical protein
LVAFQREDVIGVLFDNLLRDVALASNGIDRSAISPEAVSGMARACFKSHLASGRRIIAVIDNSFGAIDLLNAVRHRRCTITRRRLDARLFDPPARPQPGTIARHA